MKNLFVLGLSLLVLPLTTTMADAQKTLACAYDRPCITDLYISTKNALIVEVNASGYDVINTRWSRRGRSGGNTGYKGGNNRRITILSGTTAGVTYTVAVQGCNTRVLRTSICSPWDSQSIKAY